MIFEIIQKKPLLACWTISALLEAEIQDKSKADALLKGVTACQILVTFVSVVVRWVRGFAVTQLEIATFAFSIRWDISC
jgi:hypothetical protein